MKKKFVPTYAQARILVDFASNPHVKKQLKKRGLKIDRAELDRMLIDSLDAEAARMGLKLVKRKGAKR